MDLIELIERACDATAKRITDVRPDQLSSPTPCGDWTLRNLLNHVVVTLDLVGRLGNGEDVPVTAFESEATAATERIGHDPAGAFAGVAARVVDVWKRPGTLEGIYRMPFGEAPGAVVANIAALEVLVHGWDIAVATGQDRHLDPELASAVLGFVTDAVTDDMREPAFGPRVEVSASASVGDQLVGYLGRQP